MSKKYQVKLSEQDLSDFLDGNQDWMEQYRAKLESDLSKYGEAEVEVTRQQLTDKIFVDSDDEELDEYDEKMWVGEVMNRMVNDWSWLKQ